jgi:hypothetical protein
VTTDREAEVDHRLTVDQYHELIARHIIPEDIGTELIDGFLVRKDRSAVGGDLESVGNRHRVAMLALGGIRPEFDGFGCFLQTGDPIAIRPRDEPEPDASVIRGDIEGYRHGPPRPPDVLCVLEVSDNSLKVDTTTKLRVYAAAGIPVYVVVDLQHDVVLVHRDPQPDGNHPAPAELRRGDRLSLPAGGVNMVDVDVARLL